MENSKSETLNSKQVPNVKEQGSKRYDLADRTLAFAKAVSTFAKSIPTGITNREYVPQLIRAAGSVGANYIEANDSLSKKDFVMRIKISRKEARESAYWMKLVDLKEHQEVTRQKLIQEATELMKIFGAIVTKSTAS